MKKKKMTIKLQAVFLCLLLLGGCTMLEGCEAFYQIIGTLTGQTATTTLFLAVFSDILISAIDEGKAAAITYTDEGSGWYACSPMNTPVLLKCTDSGGSPQVINDLSDLSGTDVFSIRMLSGEGAVSSDIQLNWSTPSSTPTADGTLTYTTGDGGCTGTFTDITYDMVSSSVSTLGYPKSGTALMQWTMSNALFSNFNILLTYEADCGATGTVGLGTENTGLGSTELTAVSGGFTPSVSPYTIVFVDSNGASIDITQE